MVKNFNNSKFIGPLQRKVLGQQLKSMQESESESDNEENQSKSLGKIAGILTGLQQTPKPKLEPESEPEPEPDQESDEELSDGDLSDGELSFEGKIKRLNYMINDINETEGKIHNIHSVSSPEIAHALARRMVRILENYIKLRIDVAGTIANETILVV